jgi:hypothetical protein
MLIMQVYHDSDRMRDLDHMPDSGRKARLQSYAQLLSKDMTPVICLTPVERYDSGRISRLRSHFLILVNVMTLVVSTDSDHASQLQ